MSLDQSRKIADNSTDLQTKFYRNVAIKQNPPPFLLLN